MLVPVPSVAVLCALFVFPDTALGKSCYMLGKVWIGVSPILWLLFVDSKYDAELKDLSFGRRLRLGLSSIWGRTTARGVWAGVVSGVVIGVAIVGGYFLFGAGLIDISTMRAGVEKAGLLEPGLYIGLVLYLTFVNSLLEEYIWRWFVTKHVGVIIKNRTVAVVISALCFMLHHTVALSFYLAPMAVAVCSVGVIAGGMIWSALYLKYRSMLVIWISHIMADIAAFGMGYYILFI